MEVNVNVKEGLQFGAFYLFFILFNTQVGVGILGVPKFIFKEAQQDSWISILIALVYIIIVLMAMFLILNQYKNADIFGIQVDIFGQWFGKFLGTIYIVYFILGIATILLTYIQVIKIFLFPTMPSFVMGLLLLSLVVYSVLGGIRVIVGIAFIFFFLTIWVLILLYDPITRMEMTHFQPMFQASFPQLLQGAKTTTYTFLGLEMLFIIYPYIENKEKTKLPATLGVCFTAFIVLLFTTISIGYYSPEDFDKIDWAVLRLFKSISFPLLERFDYVVVAEWMMVTLPTMIFLMWSVTHGTKRLYAIRQKTTLYTVSIILLIVCSFVKYEHVFIKITDIVSEIGFWIIFVYPIVLLPIVLMTTKWRKHKDVPSSEK